MSPLVVGLSPTALSDGSPSASRIAASGGQGNAIAHDARYFKARWARCVAWQHKLEQFAQLCARYRLFPPLPTACVGASSPFPVRALPVPDVLESAEEWWGPVERDASLHVSCERTHEAALAALLERKAAMEAMQEMDSNAQMRRGERQKEGGQTAGEEARGEEKEDPDPEKGLGSRASLSHRGSASALDCGLDLAHTYTASRTLNPPSLADFRKHGNANRPTAPFKGVVCGTIPVWQQARLRRMLFRLSRGNALIRRPSTAGH